MSFISCFLVIYLFLNIASFLGVFSLFSKVDPLELLFFLVLHLSLEYVYHILLGFSLFSQEQGQSLPVLLPILLNQRINFLSQLERSPGGSKISVPVVGIESAISSL